ncbi:MAG: hypothetical protein ACK4LB_15650 [Spirosomataceae bacterium]
MKLLSTIFYFLLLGPNLYSQSLNQYLNGVWKMQCCDSDYWIIYKNSIFWINETNFQNISKPFIYFCIPRVLTYEELADGRREYKKSIPLDSVDFDKAIVPDPETGIEEIYLMEYQSDDVINQKEILITDTPLSLSLYHIDPEEKNQFYVWDGTAPSKIVYYNRILNPPVYVLEFFKKIAPDRFRKIVLSKSPIFDNFKKTTKMYLIKDDTVEIIAEESLWLHIRFYGPRKTIEGWIKKTDVE